MDRPRYEGTAGDDVDRARGRAPDPERHIEEARRSLLAHVGELGRRFKAARGMLDVSSHIAAHPLAAAGAAFALGALIGMRGGRRRRDRDRDRELRDEGRAYRGGGELPRAGGGLVLAGIGALAVRMAKEIAMREASDAVLRWWDSRRSLDVPAVRVPDDRYGRYEH